MRSSGSITRGILRDGTRLLPFPMDCASFSTLTPDDLNAIVAYLRTVPPVSNKVPRPIATVSAGLPVGQVQDADPRRRSADGLLRRQRRREGSAVMKTLPQMDADRARPSSPSAAFVAFLYFIPPFFITPPEDVRQGRWPRRRRRRRRHRRSGERAIAARGRYIVMTDRLHRLPRDQRLAGART